MPDRVQEGLADDQTVVKATSGVASASEHDVITAAAFGRFGADDPAPVSTPTGSAGSFDVLRRAYNGSAVPRARNRNNGREAVTIQVQVGCDGIASVRDGDDNISASRTTSRGAPRDGHRYQQRRWRRFTRFIFIGLEIAAAVLAGELGRAARRTARARRTSPLAVLIGYWRVIAASLFTLLIGTALTRFIAMGLGTLLGGTAAFIALTLVAYIVVSAVWRKQPPEMAIARLVVLMSGYCMWLMWMMCYMDQLHPLIRPERMQTGAAASAKAARLARGAR
ncbi:hypothetical protein CDCA_CDCA03G1080 [Cyanidium caldarium]|uniref:Uncharacterized protein n=1 Tax=Cyanidium caldarium TaxID=2771 RepID=A0AAV9IRY0_CYACA|nr:hypothetical protein CDCA_CDCA03G1080 [Cyanidium caldarium]